MSAYVPPFTISSEMVSLIEKIGEELGRYSSLNLSSSIQPYLRRVNRIKTIQATCAIEGNSLKNEDVTAIIDGKRILGAPSEIQEIRNAILAYEQMDNWNSGSITDLKDAHKIMMTGLVDTPGSFRKNGVGIQRDKEIIHLAPPAENVPFLMNDLFTWLNNSNDHPLITSSVFHYEFEFIHPFDDGNGRIGRLWQTLILSKWKPLFSITPIESLIRDNQKEYYAALNNSTGSGTVNPFIVFMLDVILKAIATASEIAPQDPPQVTPYVKELLVYLEKGSASITEIIEALKLSDRKNLMSSRINPALDEGLVERTIPDKPKSRYQKYRLTDVGKRFLQYS